MIKLKELRENPQGRRDGGEKLAGAAIVHRTNFRCAVHKIHVDVDMSTA
jgi:hypothetical protein